MLFSDKSNIMLNSFSGFQPIYCMCCIFKFNISLEFISPIVDTILPVRLSVQVSGSQYPLWMLKQRGMKIFTNLFLFSRGIQEKLRRLETSQRRPKEKEKKRKKKAETEGQSPMW